MQQTKTTFPLAIVPRTIRTRSFFSEERAATAASSNAFSFDYLKIGSPTQKSLFSPFIPNQCLFCLCCVYLFLCITKMISSSIRPPFSCQGRTQFTKKGEENVCFFPSLPPLSRSFFFVPFTSVCCRFPLNPTA